MDHVTARYSFLLRRLSHSLSDARVAYVRSELESLRSASPVTAPRPTQGVERESRERKVVSSVEIAHPWPEWTELMDRLVKKGYIDLNTLGSPKNANHVRSACLDFARDRSDLIRHFSRRDIHIMSGAGCPSLDRKVINSGKRLRSHVGIDEGNVCSSCNLRGGCERAYVKAREDEGGRTLDVMRFLLTYGLDLTTGSVENKSCLSNVVKESVRKLIKEMVEFSSLENDSSTPKSTSRRSSSSLTKELNVHHSPRAQINVPMKQGDWICPKCDFLNFAKNIKCLRCNGIFQERLNRLREEQEHLPLKKGDWICEMCNFLNFAKNSRCLQCQEKPSKRELNPGEWECVSCNYINFRRNMVCLKCDWKRPKVSSSGEFAAEQFPVDDRGHQHQHPAISFVRNSSDTEEHHSLRHKPSVEEEEAKFWDGSDDGYDRDDARNNFAAVDNFPILRGKSVVSRDPLMSERWKEKMLRSREKESVEEYGGESASPGPTFSESDESSDEDEIAGWFRHKTG